MAIHREYGNAANDPGVWEDYGTDPDNGKPVRVRVRGIPAADEEKIRRDGGVWQSKQTVRFVGKRGTSEIDIELEKEKAVARGRASFAMVETENWCVFIGDEETAEAYRALCPGAPVEIGKDLLLDKLWASGAPSATAVRAHYFEEHSDLATWIIGKVDGEKTRTLERQEDLRKN